MAPFKRNKKQHIKINGRNRLFRLLDEDEDEVEDKNPWEVNEDEDEDDDDEWF